MNEDIAEEKLSETIIKLIKEKNPEDVKQLVALVNEKESLPEEKIVERIISLQNEGKIRFQRPPQREIRKLNGYLHTEDAYWYWATVALIIVTTVTVFTIPEDAYPLVYARYVLGTIFVVWLPGYTFVKALFPSTPPVKTSATSLDAIERVALSIGMSLALLPIVGLLLNYTPWGIRLTPIVLSLLFLTVMFSTVALLREYQNQISKTKRGT